MAHPQPNPLQHTAPDLAARTALLLPPQMRMLSSAASAAAAICNHVRDWLCPRPLLWRWRRRVVSMGVMSGGAYGVPPGIFFSFPVRCGGGAWEVDEVRETAFAWGLASWRLLELVSCSCGPFS